MLPLIVSFQGKHNFSYENFNMNKKGFGYAKNIVSTVMLCFRVEECKHTGLVWLTLPLGRVYVCVCVLRHRSWDCRQTSCPTPLIITDGMQLS